MKEVQQSWCKIQCINGEDKVEISWKKGPGFLHNNSIKALKRMETPR